MSVEVVWRGACGRCLCGAIALLTGSSSVFPSFLARPSRAGRLFGVVPVPGTKKLPLHRNIFCARAGSFILWCHLACRGNTAATLRRANTPLPGNGGSRQRIRKARRPFPRALSEPFVCPALRPVPSLGGSLWVRRQFYFRFNGLVQDSTDPPVCQGPGRIFLFSVLEVPLYAAPA